MLTPSYCYFICCPEKPKLFWRLPLTVCGYRPAPHLQSNKFKGKKIAGSLHMVVPWPPTTVFPSVTAALKKKQKNNIFRLHLADSIEALPTESVSSRQMKAPCDLVLYNYTEFKRNWTDIKVWKFWSINQTWNSQQNKYEKQELMFLA